jgi:flagellar motor switch protein FliG
MFILENRKFYTVNSDLNNVTLEEKINCGSLINDIVKLSLIARTEGMLALESVISEIAEKEPFLSDGITWIIDGCDRQFVSEVLHIAIVADGKVGIELLRQQIMLDGLLQLQEGNNPRVIRERLLIYLGREVSRVLKKLFESDFQFETMITKEIRKPAEIRRAYTTIKSESDVNEKSKEDWLRVVLTALKGANQYYDDATVLSSILDLHTKTLCNLLVCIKPRIGAVVLYHFNYAEQTAIIDLIARLSVEDVKFAHESQTNVLETLVSGGVQKINELNGKKIAAQLLNSIEYGARTYIMAKLDAELLFEIKENMFFFDSIAYLDDIAIQRMLRDIDCNDLTIALKRTTQNVYDKVTMNLSERQRKILADDMCIKNAGTWSITESQKRIINSIHRLEDSGEIVIPYERIEY